MYLRPCYLYRRFQLGHGLLRYYITIRVSTIILVSVIRRLLYVIVRFTIGIGVRVGVSARSYLRLPRDGSCQAFDIMRVEGHVNSHYLYPRRFRLQDLFHVDLFLNLLMITCNVFVRVLVRNRDLLYRRNYMVYILSLYSHLRA